MQIFLTLTRDIWIGTWNKDRMSRPEFHLLFWIWEGSSFLKGKQFWKTLATFSFLLDSASTQSFHSVYRARGSFQVSQADRAAIMSPVCAWLWAGTHSPNSSVALFIQHPDTKGGFLRKLTFQIHLLPHSSWKTITERFWEIAKDDHLTFTPWKTKTNRKK